MFIVKLLTLTVPAPRSKAYNLGKEAITLVAKCQRNRGNLRKLSKAHVCPEMHAVTKMADLLMELTILANIGQIRQSKISLADFVDFDAFLPIFVTAGISGHIQKLIGSNVEQSCTQT